MISIIDLHWAAGFLEGEGSFKATNCYRDKKSTSYSVNLHISAVQAESYAPLNRLKFLFGGAICKVKRYQAHHRERKCWTACGAEAAGAMMTLYSLLSTKRKTQITRALYKWKSTQPASKFRIFCPRGHPYSRMNTYLNPNGGRQCRRCHAEYVGNVRQARNYHL